MQILHLVVARGGSKGVPGKNLRTLKLGPHREMSLVALKCASARASTRCNRLVCSTDSAEIADEARRHGAEVPWLRPAHLAADDTPTDAVVAHALDTLDGDYDAVMLLEPSSPFVPGHYYDSAVNQYVQRRQAGETVHVIAAMRHVHTNRMFVGAANKGGAIADIVTNMQRAPDLRRQAQSPEWTMCGGFYLIDVARFRAAGNRIYGRPEECFGLGVPQAFGLEIDTPYHMAIAQCMVNEGAVSFQLGFYWGNENHHHV